MGVTTSTRVILYVDVTVDDVLCCMLECCIGKYVCTMLGVGQQVTSALSLAWLQVKFKLLLNLH